MCMSKHTFSLLVFLGITMTVNAQSLLRVHLADNSRINVSVNGRYFNRQGTTVTVGDLPPGRHLLKIYNVSYDRWGRSFDRLVFQGTVNTSVGMITNFLFDPRTRTMSANRNPIDNSRNAYRPSQPDDNYREYSNDQNRYEPPTAENAVPEPLAEEDNSTVAPLPSGTPAASPVPEGTFTEAKSNKIKAKVDAKATDTEKLKYMKEALKQETITTFQVSYMMDWFLFESTKVDFAKWAYAITTDKDFYDDLSSKFNYSSSKDDFKKFLDSRK